MFQLTIQCRSGEARTYLLNRKSLTMGSGTDCDVAISSPFVAPLVARLEWEEGKGYRLQAAPGQRTLTVNGHPVLSALLRDGDEIRSGEFAGTLSTVADSPDTAWSEPPALYIPEAAARPELGFEEVEEIAEIHENRPPEPEPEPDEEIPFLLEDLEREEAPQPRELSEPPPFRSRASELDSPLPETPAELEPAPPQNLVIPQGLAFGQPPATLQLEPYAQERDDAARHMERADAARQLAELRERLLHLEKQLMGAEADARRRVERAHETIANLRKVIVQQDGELREQRQNLLKLQQAKNAAETQLESIRKAYARERRQHGRLIDQFRERARRETARADRALDELARARQEAPGLE